MLSGFLTVQVTTTDVRAEPRVPLYGDHYDAMRAREAGMATTWLRPEDRSASVNLPAIVLALIGDQLLSEVDWHPQVWEVFQERVEAEVNRRGAWAHVDFSKAGLPAIVNVVVQVVREILGPAGA